MRTKFKSVALSLRRWGRAPAVALGFAVTVACSASPGSSSSSDGGSSSSSGASSSSTGSGSSGSSGGTGSSGSGSSSGSTLPSGATACGLSNTLRGTSTCHFLIGMGNDLNPNSNHNLDGAYTLGTTLDLHYAYMVGLPTKGGWPDWNANGTFVNVLSDSADAHGVTPMYTLYAMAAEGDGNWAMTTDSAAMGLYWQGAKLLFQRIAVFNKPAVVQLEPDFWGYALNHSADGTASVVVSAPDCAGMPGNLIGMAQCLVKLARTYAPKAAVGFHASDFGFTAQQVVTFFQAIHADTADFVATDVLDRDAGCFELHTDPNCMRGGTTGWYWDETNQTSPNFTEHLTWVKAVHDGLNLPVLWWQLPFGVPSTTPGGSSGHYRDNRVHYLFNHTSEFIAAGGMGAVFGTGAGNQTYITTDNNQFKNAVTSYFASPMGL